MLDRSHELNFEHGRYLPAVFLGLSLMVVGIHSIRAIKKPVNFGPRIAPSMQATPGWQMQSSGTSQVLLGVSFTDVNRGYAVGTSGVIRVSQDGGNTWSGQSSGTSRFLRDVCFSDGTHGVIVGESGLILRTTDGITWNQQASGTTQHLVHVHFVNNNLGIATGQGGVILRSTDGGVTWTQQNSGTNVELPGAYMIDENTAIVVGFSGTILRTINGGNTWTSISVPSFASDLRSVHFFGLSGVAVSIGGRVLKSTDGGQSWNEVSSGTSNNLYAVRFINANTVYAVGTAKVLGSQDGGSTWTASATTPFSGDLYGLSFSSANGWAVGQNGLILHAENLVPSPTPTPTPTPTASPIRLILEESSPAPDQTAAVDSVLLLRDPLPVVNNANLLNPGPDRNTRVMIFVTNLQLAQGESPDSVVVNLVDANSQSYNVPAEDVRPVPNFSFTQVIFRLPNSLSTGTCAIKVQAHNQVSNPGTMRIRL